MALTVKTLKEPGVPKFYTVTEVTFSNSYTEGGEVFTPAKAGLATIDHALCQLVNGSESAELRPSVCFYSGEKLHLIDSATGKEMAKEKDMSKVKVQVFAFGKTRVH